MASCVAPVCRHFDKGTLCSSSSTRVNCMCCLDHSYNLHNIVCAPNESGGQFAAPHCLCMLLQVCRSCLTLCRLLGLADGPCLLGKCKVYTCHMSCRNAGLRYQAIVKLSSDSAVTDDPNLARALRVWGKALCVRASLQENPEVRPWHYRLTVGSVQSTPLVCLTYAKKVPTEQ